MTIDPNELADPAGEPPTERRRMDRTRDTDWESKVVGRLNGSIHRLDDAQDGADQAPGWESAVLDVLRRKIEKGPG